MNICSKQHARDGRMLPARGVPPAAGTPWGAGLLWIAGRWWLLAATMPPATPRWRLLLLLLLSWGMGVVLGAQGWCLRHGVGHMRVGGALRQSSIALAGLPPAHAHRVEWEAARHSQLWIALSLGMGKRVRAARHTCV